MYVFQAVSLSIHLPNYLSNYLTVKHDLIMETSISSQITSAPEVTVVASEHNVETEDESITQSIRAKKVTAHPKYDATTAVCMSAGVGHGGCGGWGIVAVGGGVWWV